MNEAPSAREGDHAKPHTGDTRVHPAGCPCSRYACELRRKGVAIQKPPHAE